MDRINALIFMHPSANSALNLLLMMNGNVRRTINLQWMDGISTINIMLQSSNTLLIGSNTLRTYNVISK